MSFNTLTKGTAKVGGLAFTSGETKIAKAPFGQHAFTIGAEAANVINVSVQLKDGIGANMAKRSSLRFYLADDANGDTPSSSAPDGGIAIGTNGALIENNADLNGSVISEADGTFDIDLTHSGVATWYLVLVKPDGTLAVSDAITFA